MKRTNRGKDFQAFDMQRALRDDPELDIYGYAFLMACTNRVDNTTCKVRASLAMLASDAKMNERTVTRLLKTAAVTKYFEVIEGQTRAKNLWLYEEPSLIPDSQSVKDDKQESIQGTDSGLTDTDSRLTDTDSRLPVIDSRLPVTPSTYTSTPTSTNTSTEGKDNKVPSSADAESVTLSGLKTFLAMKSDTLSMVNSEDPAPMGADIEPKYPSSSTAKANALMGASIEPEESINDKVSTDEAKDAAEHMDLASDAAGGSLRDTQGHLLDRVDQADELDWLGLFEPKTTQMATKPIAASTVLSIAEIQAKKDNPPTCDCGKSRRYNVGEDRFDCLNVACPEYAYALTN